MNKELFAEQMARLERLYGNCPASEEYFAALRYLRPADFVKAVNLIIETHYPTVGHKFPSVSLILEAVNEVIRGRPWESEEDREGIEYCQRCSNLGIYLDSTGMIAKFCDCLRGKKKEIVFRYWPDNRRIIEEQAKIKSSAPPHHGLRERNALGFWEMTQEEHERHMGAKRKEIEEIDKRRAKNVIREKIPDDVRRFIIKEIISSVREKIKIEK